MARTERERRKLLTRASRSLGLLFTGASLLSLLVAVLDEPAVLWPSLSLMAATGVAFYFVGGSRTQAWPLFTYVIALLALGAFLAPGQAVSSVAATSAVTFFASTAIPSLIPTLASSGRLLWLVLPAYVLVLGLAVAATWPSGRGVFVIASILVGWLSLFVCAVWLSGSLRRAFVGMARLGRAHALERQSSEFEAQRRQGARLLHDTVLATLTLLAHSGIGADPDALRHQAAEDARLLRQLRLGGTPMPRSSGGYTLERVETGELGHTLESVKQRFGRMGLQVSWHGTGQILLPSHVLDAFLLSLSECLENVRRHAQVGTADVTITEDDLSVRAMVTDAGVGFDLDSVDVGRLGLAESVIARVRDVGGKVRLFSSPGSGTTVVLEVPK
ncbi:histidine kinase [Herbiconiux sp. KACC 21604]|uniref:sensor histidine kinase n=1 Tax=unclassified Herbiconiux TaxID=2618217 RepID=UPI001490F085|nr:ATP-binding protein [Herbiconiux sp. SALV-R1]QJU53815.1 histidine kinase [Herbiconiux sp. SALV-R1]WPO84824.1 histidine kinase [Herbiconiux sp. KACC 21604]